MRRAASPLSAQRRKSAENTIVKQDEEEKKDDDRQNQPRNHDRPYCYIIQVVLLLFQIGAVATYVTRKFIIKSKEQLVQKSVDGASCFDDPLELRQAIDFYLLAQHNQSFRADFEYFIGRKYGSNVSNFCFTEQMTDMSFLFDAQRNQLAEFFSFPDDLCQWDVSHVQRMDGTFANAKGFNQPIGKSWNTHNVQNMSFLFKGASSFNQDISEWDTSSVEDMSSMFKEAAAFNQPINTWNVSKVKRTHSMFYRTGAFNQPLDRWDTAHIFDMTLMFAHAQSFNCPINDWDVSNVQVMTQMFTDAPLFNQPLDKWQPRKATMTRMFDLASSFDQDLCVWGTCCLLNRQDVKIQAIFDRTRCPAQETTRLDIIPVSPLCHVCG